MSKSILIQFSNQELVRDQLARSTIYSLLINPILRLHYKRTRLDPSVRQGRAKPIDNDECGDLFIKRKLIFFVKYCLDVKLSHALDHLLRCLFQWSKTNQYTL